MNERIFLQLFSMKKIHKTSEKEFSIFHSKGFRPRGVRPPAQEKIAMSKVPTHVKPNPKAAFFDNFSLNTIREKSTVSKTLVLSIGTTTLTTPFCNA